MCDTLLLIAHVAQDVQGPVTQPVRRHAGPNTLLSNSDVLESQLIPCFPKFAQGLLLGVAAHTQPSCRNLYRNASGLVPRMGNLLGCLRPRLEQRLVAPVVKDDVEAALLLASSELARAAARGGFEKDYTLGKLIGHGAFAKVYACTHVQSGRDFAVKVLQVGRAAAAASSTSHVGNQPLAWYACRKRQTRGGSGSPSSRR